MSITVKIVSAPGRLNLHWLRRFAEIALDRCRSESGDSRFALRTLPAVEVTVVSDRVIARVHSNSWTSPPQRT